MARSGPPLHGLRCDRTLLSAPFDNAVALDVAANVGQVSELLPNLDVCSADAACPVLSGGRRVPAYGGLGVGCPLTFNRSAGRPV
jgi:hypothetical protein